LLVHRSNLCSSRLINRDGCRPTALAESNPYNILTDAHRPKIEEHPSFILRVVPHPSADSGHLDKYDILIDDKPSNHLPKPNIWQRLLKLALVVPKGIGAALIGVVVAAFVTTVVLPLHLIGVAVRSRRARADLAKLGVKRRNAESLKRWFDLRAPLHVDMPWKKMREVLEKKAPFSRVDVYLDGPNTHGTIIARRTSPWKRQGEQVMDYVFDKCLL
jgi:hypothetical protein